MLADGVPLVIVFGQLGHGKASSTANIYGHVISSAQAKALQTFDQFSDVVAPATMPLESDVLKQQTTDKRQNEKRPQQHKKKNPVTIRNVLIKKYSQTIENTSFISYHPEQRQV